MYLTEILVCTVLASVLTGLFFALKVHDTASLLAPEEKDFITRFLEYEAEELRRASAGIPLSVYLVLRFVLAFALFGLGLAWLENPWFSAALGVVGFFIPHLLLGALCLRNRKKFEERYARSLEQLSSSLRAGMSIMQAVGDVASCVFVHESIRRKYALLSADLQMGIPLEDAFLRFAEGTDSPDAEDVASAIAIQNEVGGHEDEVVLEIAKNIKDRIMLRREVTSIFAETSSMVWIMDFVPYLVMVGYLAANPSAAGFFFSGAGGILLLSACFILPAFGSMISHRALDRVKKGA